MDSHEFPPQGLDEFEERRCVLQIRLSRDEKASIERSAARAGLTMSDFVRQACLDDVMISEPPVYELACDYGE